MLIISFDAVSDGDFTRLSGYPAVSAFMRQTKVFRGVSTVFLSNTYPVHTSVATGVLPAVHGLVSNTQPFPARHPVWNARESAIRAQTLWQAAARRGISTAAVFWPVTAFSKTIRYNIPEVLARPGKSQLAASLKAGSKALQLKMFLRHRGLLTGTGQPGLDNFAAASMADILREHNPGLALVHLTVYDALLHRHGKSEEAVKTAFDALDANLALLLSAAGDRDVLIFSDHSQTEVHTVLDPNTLLVQQGLLRKSGEEYLPGKDGCYVECAGGSSFFHAGALSPRQIDALREHFGKGEGFGRFLTGAELNEAGHGAAAFGFCAREGYCYEAFAPPKKGNHGYPPDMSGSTVFYMARGFGLRPGAEERGGSLLDIAPLAARRLGFSLPAP